MSWQEGFRNAMAEAIIEHGTVANERGDDETIPGWTRNWYYGLIDYEAATHLREECSIAYWRDIKEESWMGFVSTFDDSTTQYGMSLTFDCACGKLKDRTLVWEAPFGEALQEILKGAL